MYRLAVPILILAAGLATGAATSQSPDAARLAKKLSGFEAGEARKCVDRIHVQRLDPYKATILFVQSRNKFYRNTVVGTCAGLARGDLIVTKSFSGQYCRGDTVQTRAVPGGQLTGICSLGEFVPYSKAR